MKRIVLLTTGIAALVFSGLAVAHATLSHSIKGVSATFAATSVSNLRTSSCVGAEGNPFNGQVAYVFRLFPPPPAGPLGAPGSGPVRISPSLPNTSEGIVSDFRRMPGNTANAEGAFMSDI